MPSEIEQYLNTALDLARHAGKTMLEGFHGTKTVTTKSSQWDLVTEFDKKVEKILTEGFYKAYPSHKYANGTWRASSEPRVPGMSSVEAPRSNSQLSRSKYSQVKLVLPLARVSILLIHLLFIGEETVAGDKSEPILTDAPTWIVDPIDGTTNFVHGFHLACISIGLAINKEMVVGVIYNPILDEMYTASKGQGAKLNGIPIHTSKVTREYLVDVFQFQMNVTRFRALGSAAITMCYVAAGSLDAYQCNGLQSWDVAAGALIISEAGGVVMNTDGSPFDVMARKLVCAGTRKLADEIVEIIKQADTFILPEAHVVGRSECPVVACRALDLQGPCCVGAVEEGPELGAGGGIPPGEGMGLGDCCGGPIGLGVCGGGIGEDCGEGLAIPPRSEDTSSFTG
uniref:Inositol-1-monophosphatase n=1 Tax=Timema genevievae TaxID=629358 RepID=A0A7R9JNC7_TIMGE|nr:unnamed protein product [Timema genevievae]